MEAESSWLVSRADPRITQPAQSSHEQHIVSTSGQKSRAQPVHCPPLVGYGVWFAEPHRSQYTQATAYNLRRCIESTNCGLKFDPSTLILLKLTKTVRNCSWSAPINVLPYLSAHKGYASNSYRNTPDCLVRPFRSIPGFGQNGKNQGIYIYIPTSLTGHDRRFGLPHISYYNCVCSPMKQQ